MRFEDFLREYDGVMAKFYSGKKRVYRKLKNVELREWKRVSVIAAMIIAGAIYCLVKVANKVQGDNTGGDTQLIILMVAILIGLLFGGRFWIGSQEEINADKKRCKDRLGILNKLLVSYDIKSRVQIEELRNMAKEYKPRFLKVIMGYKNLIMFLALQIGIPISFFILTYIAEREEYKTEVRTVAYMLILVAINVTIIFILLAMLIPIVKEVFMKKYVIAEELCDDLELMLIIFPLKESTKKLEQKIRKKQKEK